VSAVPDLLLPPLLPPAVVPDSVEHPELEPCVHKFKAGNLFFLLFLLFYFYKLVLNLHSFYHKNRGKILYAGSCPEDY
jgi:hypothetical protein